MSASISQGRRPLSGALIAGRISTTPDVSAHQDRLEYRNPRRGGAGVLPLSGVGGLFGLDDGVFLGISVETVGGMMDSLVVADVKDLVAGGEAIAYLGNGKVGILISVVRMIDTKEDSLEDLKDKILLILTPSYPNEDESFIVGTFVKYQIAELKHYFKRVIVIAPVLRSFGYFQKDRLCRNYSYENVEVYYPRCIYIPIFWLRKILIDNRLQVVEQIIEEHHLHFDLVHAHFTWPSGYIGVSLKEKYGKPVITTIHENGDWFDHEVGMDHPLINAAWSEADALIRVNKKDVPVLQRYNKCVYSIPNGFSPAFHSIEMVMARKKIGLPTDAKIIFTLGGLIKRKGFNYLIDAMKQVCDHRNDVFCFIGGTGPERENLKRQIERLNLGEQVKLLGSVPSESLPLWMNAANLFVLPSLSESFGVVQIEALACGKPVVSARNRGSEEVITSDEYGLLAEPANSEDLAEKILVALDREWDREAILKYAQRFTWGNVVKELLNVHALLV